MQILLLLLDLLKTENVHCTIQLIFQVPTFAKLQKVVCDVTRICNGKIMWLHPHNSTQMLLTKWGLSFNFHRICWDSVCWPTIFVTLSLPPLLFCCIYFSVTFVVIKLLIMFQSRLRVWGVLEDSESSYCISHCQNFTTVSTCVYGKVSLVYVIVIYIPDIDDHYCSHCRLSLIVSVIHTKSRDDTRACIHAAMQQSVLCL